jgi:hypothetical protein
MAYPAFDRISLEDHSLKCMKVADRAADIPGVSTAYRDTPGILALIGWAGESLAVGEESADPLARTEDITAAQKCLRLYEIAEDDMSERFETTLRSARLLAIREWPRICATADMLLERETLTYDELFDACSDVPSARVEPRVPDTWEIDPACLYSGMEQPDSPGIRSVFALANAWVNHQYRFETEHVKVIDDRLRALMRDAQGLQLLVQILGPIAALQVNGTPEQLEKVRAELNQAVRLVCCGTRMDSSALARAADGVAAMTSHLKWKIGRAYDARTELESWNIEYSDDQQRARFATGQDGKPSYFLYDLVRVLYYSLTKGEWVGNQDHLREEISDILAPYFLPDQIDPCHGPIENALEYERQKRVKRQGDTESSS